MRLCVCLGLAFGRRHRVVGTFVSSLLLISTSAFAQANTEFDPGCSLPFKAIAVEHPGVDDFCGIEGITSLDDVGNQNQNKLKNNFCLKSQPVILTPNDLVNLQKKVDDLEEFKYGSGRSVPEDRSPLKSITKKGETPIGEGTLVTVVGYMIDPHYSDVQKGEGVNCKKHGDEPNDIHFNIADKGIDVEQLDKETKQAQLCKLVSGEISPHFRPESWEVDHLDKLAHLQVRLTGQLFFDASHVPCRRGKPVNPARSSVWEIHPTYSVDVCKKKKKGCSVDVASDWIPLSEFSGQEDEENASERDQ